MTGDSGSMTEKREDTQGMLTFQFLRVDKNITIDWNLSENDNFLMGPTHVKMKRYHLMP